MEIVNNRRVATEAAQVAKFIRNDLKSKYPHVRFKVRSENFAGGDAVRIDYTMEDETYPKPEQVEGVVGKYQAGNFDGMTDCYNYDYSKKWLTVKYVQLQVDTKPLEEKHKQNFLNHYGLTAFEDQEIMSKLNMWKEQALYQYIRKVVFAK